MFLGIDCFKDEEVFENIVMFGDMNYLEIGNAKFDEMYITEDTTDINNVKDNSWIFGSTVFSSGFGNTPFGGNISGNLNVGYMKIKRKKVEDLVWEDLKILPYVQNQVNYSYIDNFVEALEEYEYIIQPIATNGALGNMQSQSIEVADFDGAWLVTEDETLSLLYNLNIGDYDMVMPSATVETLGYQYPFVMTNGYTKYRRCSVQCMIMSDATRNNCGIVDRKQEKIFRQNVYNFLTDKKPKVYKDSSGEYMVVSIIGEPKISPINELSQQIYELSFDCVEVGTKELLTLHHTGIIK